MEVRQSGVMLFRSLALEGGGEASNPCPLHFILHLRLPRKPWEGMRKRVMREMGRGNSGGEEGRRAMCEEGRLRVFMPMGSLRMGVNREM